MADREKVIKGLEEVDAYFHRMTEVCYRGDEATFCDLKEKVANAIALLKEQEEEIENLKQTAQSMMEGICLLKEQETREKNRLPYSPDSNVQWT